MARVLIDIVTVDKVTWLVDLTWCIEGMRNRSRARGLKQDCRIKSARERRFEQEI
jgi:hypothetical protein